MQKNLFKYLLTITTTMIAGTAAFFSVWGIGKLFGGAEHSTMFMAASLELGKLVTVTFLYRYWKQIRMFFRTYLVLGALSLVLITSAGIYGYLSSAYATAAVGFQAQRGEITLVEARQSSLTSTYQSNLDRIKNNDTRVNQLQQYRLQQETRLDSLVGRNGFVTQQGIVRQADNDIRRLQAENREIEKENIGLLAQRDSLGTVKLLKETETNTNSKLGTFWYIAEAIGVPLDDVVKWFILIIVLVFDPLSISLVIAYNVIKREEHRMEEANAIPMISHPGPSPEELERARDAVVTTAGTHDKTTWYDLRPAPVKVEHIPTEDNNDLLQDEEWQGEPEVLPEEAADQSSGLPYYMQHGFDWKTDERWKSDPEARMFEEQIHKSRS